MDEKKLENFIKMNSKVPEAPVNEWANIVNGIDEKRSHSFWGKLNLKQVGVGFASVMVIAFFGLNHDEGSSYNVNSLKKEQLESFLSESDYFDQDQDQYGWIDND